MSGHAVLAHQTSASVPNCLLPSEDHLCQTETTSKTQGQQRRLFATRLYTEPGSAVFRLFETRVIRLPQIQPEKQHFLVLRGIFLASCFVDAPVKGRR